MKHWIYAAVTASLGMLLTSGVLVFARAATPRARVHTADVEVQAHLDTLIARQLSDVKHRL